MRPSESGRVLERVVLGTAQLGPAYGRRRRRGPLPESVVAEILNEAWNIGIRSFDTAEAYEDAPERLARWLTSGNRLNRADVVTKIAPSESSDRQKIQKAVRRFAGAARVTVLSHGECDMSTWRVLEGAAGELDAGAGVSVYDEAAIREAVSLPGIRIVQCPGNVLTSTNLRIPGPGTGGSMDFRSIYLQGLLLDAPAEAERRVPGAGEVASRISAVAADFTESLPELLIGAVLRARPPQDRVVLGVDHPRQLSPIAGGCAIPVDSATRFTAAVEEATRGLSIRTVIDPRNWS